VGYAVRLHEFAHREYIEAYNWYELKKEGLGERFMDAVERKLNQISEHPEYFSKRKSDFRETKVSGFPYAIVYECLPRKKVIHVAAIYHSKPNPQTKISQEKLSAVLLKKVNLPVLGINFIQLP